MNSYDAVGLIVANALGISSSAYIGYLDRLDLNGLEYRVRDYRDRSRWFRTSEQFRRAVYAVMLTPEKSLVFLPQSQDVVAGEKMYRVRDIQKASEIKKVRDVWCRVDGVRAGRLNASGVPVFYAALDIRTALDEIGIRTDGLASIAEYEAIETVKSIHIGAEVSLPNLSVDQAQKHQLLQSFLHGIFSRPSITKQDGDYIAPEMLVSDFFTLPPDIFCGWSYSSVARTGGRNVAFRPDEAKRLLKLNRVTIATRVDHSTLSVVEQLEPPIGKQYPLDVEDMLSKSGLNSSYLSI